MRKNKRKPRRPQGPGPSSRPHWSQPIPGKAGVPLAFFSLGLLLLAFHWVVLPPFHFLLPEAGPIGLVPSWALGVAGFSCWVAAFVLGKGTKGDREGIPPWKARLWLILLLATGAAIRLYHFWEPHPSWGYDPFWELMEARNTAELGRHGLLFQLGGREPLFHYLLAVLWWVFPEASPYVVSRSVSVMLDALAVWGLYLLGKEAGGRQVGLLAAGLAVASKPLMIMTIACTRGVAVTAGAAFLLLFTLRVFKRPDFRHFLQWGLVLGACAYTYTGIRVLWLWVVLSVLVFSWWMAKRGVEGGPQRWRKWDRVLPLFAWTGGAWILLEFLGAHAYMGWKQGWQQVLGQGPLRVGLLVLAAASFAILQWGPLRERVVALRGWALGAIVACLLVLPLVLHPEFARHLGNDSIFSHHGEGAWGHLWPKVRSLFISLFLGGGGSWDRPDLNILWDAQLDLLSIPVVTLGLAYCLSRPNFLSGWLLISALAAIFPLMTSADAHSVKLLAGLPALLLLGALALGRIGTWFRLAIPGPLAGSVGTGFLVLLWICALGSLHGRIWGAFAQQRDPNMAVALEVLKEPREKRIYFAQVGDFFLPHQQNILLDGREVHSLQAVNPIHLAQGEGTPSVVVFFPGGEEYEEAGPVREELAKEFPGLPWTEFAGAGWPRKLLRMEIPPERLEARPAMFPIRRLEGADWKRVFLRETYGLGRGGYVVFEDRVVRPEDPFPRGPRMENCRLQRTLEIPRDGMAEFWVETRSWASLFLDGKVILRSRSSGGSEAPQKGSVKVPIKAGVHRLELRVHRQEEGMPVFRMVLP